MITVNFFSALSSMNKILFLFTQIEVAEQVKEAFVSKPYCQPQDHFTAGGLATSHYRPIYGWQLLGTRPLHSRLMGHVTADNLTAGCAVIEGIET